MINLRLTVTSGERSVLLEGSDEQLTLDDVPISEELSGELATWLDGGRGGRLLARRLSIELDGLAWVYWADDDVPTSFAFDRTDRVLVVSGARFDPRRRKSNKVLGTFDEAREIEELISCLQPRSDGDWSGFMTPGSPTLVLLAGRQPIAVITLVFPLMRCTQLWDTDPPSTDTEGLRGWLAERGFEFNEYGLLVDNTSIR